MTVAKRELGRTGLEVTTLGYGAMELRGAPRARDISEEQPETILNKVLDSGINYIDTSIDYGLSEERIGRYISHRRAEYYLASKCGCLVGAPPVPRGQRGAHVFTRDNIVAGVEQSLVRMKTDYLDVVQFHASPSRRTSAMGVRRDKAALSSGCKPHPAIRSSRPLAASTGAISLLGGKMRCVRAVCLPASEVVGPRVRIRLAPADSRCLTQTRPLPVEKPAVPRGCASLGSAETRRGLVEIARSGAVISVGRYCSTAVPLMSSGSGGPRPGPSSCCGQFLKQSRAGRVARARPAADVNGRAACLP